MILDSRIPGARFRSAWEQALVEANNRIAYDPDDADAHCAAAENLVMLRCYGYLRGDEALPAARKSIDAARARNPESALVLMLDGILHFNGWHWLEAETLLRRAVATPRTEGDKGAAALHWLALYCAAMGRLDEALSLSRQSVTLDHSYRLGFGSILYFAHRFDEMAAVMEELVGDAPDFAPAYDWLGMAYIQLRRYDDSIRVYRKAVELGDGTVEIAAGLGHAYGIAGRRAEAQAILDKFLSLTSSCYIPPVQIGYVAFGLGETELGLKLLKQGFDERSWFLAFAREEPWLDHLHTDPRFKELLGNMRLPAHP